MRLIMSEIIYVNESYDIPLAHFLYLCWVGSDEERKYWNDACDFYEEIMWEETKNISTDQAKRLVEIEEKMTIFRRGNR